MNNLKSTKNIQTFDYTPVPLAAGLLKDMPEVERSVAVNDTWDEEGVISAGEARLQAKGLSAGKDFFNVFSYEVVQGDKNQVLSTKDNVVISEHLARALFHATDNVIGKTIKWKHSEFEGVYQVSGIFKSPPPNSTAQFDLVFSIEVLLANDQWAKKWTNSYAKTYVVFKKGTNIQQFNAKITGLLKSKDPVNEHLSLFVQQYSAKYLHGRYENGRPEGGA
jgi:putative ABC transport system permease protein